MSLMLPQSVLFREQCVVDLHHYPVEESAVQALSHRVARRYRFRHPANNRHKLECQIQGKLLITSSRNSV